MSDSGSVGGHSVSLPTRSWGLRACRACLPQAPRATIVARAGLPLRAAGARLVTGSTARAALARVEKQPARVYRCRARRVELSGRAGPVPAGASARPCTPARSPHATSEEAPWPPRRKPLHRRLDLPTARTPTVGCSRASAIGRDPVDRDAIVERFLPLARQLAARYQRPDEPFDDVFQVACFGARQGRRPLRRSSAASRSRATPCPPSRGEIKRHFRDRTWSVRVPRDLQELALRVDRVVADLTRERGRQPSVERGRRDRRRRDRGRARGDAGLDAPTAPTSLDTPRGAGDDDPGETLGDTVGQRRRRLRPRRAARRPARAAARADARASARSSGCASRRTSPRPRSASASASARCRSRACLRQASRACARSRAWTPAAAPTHLGRAARGQRSSSRTASSSTPRGAQQGGGRAARRRGRRAARRRRARSRAGRAAAVARSRCGGRGARGLAPSGARPRRAARRGSTDAPSSTRTATPSRSRSSASSTCSGLDDRCRRSAIASRSGAAQRVARWRRHRQLAAATGRRAARRSASTCARASPSGTPRSRRAPALPAPSCAQDAEQQVLRARRGRGAASRASSSADDDDRPGRVAEALEHAAMRASPAWPGRARPRGSSSRPVEDHHEPVDPDADAAGRRHALLERGEEDLVERLRLLVALGRVARLRLEARALLVGVVELGERVGDLHRRPTNASKRSTRPGSVRCALANGDSSTG